jgi:MinD superfamily P-loop ATPase
MNIAIASGKGGTGKTLFATNFQYVLHQQGFAATLVDCDAEEPNANIFFKGKLKHQKNTPLRVPVIDEKKCTYCGLCSDYCNYNALFILPERKTIKVLEDLCHGCGACLYACTDNAITEKSINIGQVSTYINSMGAILIEAKMKVGVHSPVQVIKEALKAIDSDKITIIDAPPGTSCPFVQSVGTADFVILITEPTPFGMSDLKQAVETLKIMDKNYGVVINRAGAGNRETYSYLKHEHIPLLMEIPFDKSIAARYAVGQMVAQYKSDWPQKLMNVFNTIISLGNSSN